MDRPLFSVIAARVIMPALLCVGLVACSADKEAPATTTSTPSTIPVVPTVSGGLCEDPTGDLYHYPDFDTLVAEPASLDLVQVATTVTPKSIKVTFETKAPIDVEQTPTFTLLADTPPRSNTFDIKINGAPAGWAVVRVTYEDGTAHHATLDATPEVGERRVSVTVKRADLPTIGSMLSLNYGVEGLGVDDEVVTDECLPFGKS